MRYIYGPVNSRRLGRSLGVSLSAEKVCNFDCIYCQLGKTKHLVTARKEYAPVIDIIREIRAWFGLYPQEAKTLDYVTIAGLGEPTLHEGIHRVIGEIKAITQAKVSVITNASLLSSKELRESLLDADLVVPSLDAADPAVFSQINRPASGFTIEKIILGLVEFRKEFKGELWLEVMLVAGVNDATGHINTLKRAIERIKPDKIQLNSPVRTTTEKDVRSVSKKRLEEIQQLLGEKCEIV